MKVLDTLVKWLITPFYNFSLDKKSKEILIFLYMKNYFMNKINNFFRRLLPKYIVTISSKHLIMSNYNYWEGNSCPLYKAIREQYPQLPIKSVLHSGNIQMLNKDKMKYIGYTPNTTWNLQTYLSLKKGEIKEFKVILYK